MKYTEEQIAELKDAMMEDAFDMVDMVLAAIVCVQREDWCAACRNLADAACIMSDCAAQTMLVEGCVER